MVLTRRCFFWIVTPSLVRTRVRPAIGHTAAALHGGVIEVENGRAAAAGRTALPERLARRLRRSIAMRAAAVAAVAVTIAVLLDCDHDCVRLGTPASVGRAAW